MDLFVSQLLGRSWVHVHQTWQGGRYERAEVEWDMLCLGHHVPDMTSKLPDQRIPGPVSCRWGWANTIIYHQSVRLRVSEEPHWQGASKKEFEYEMSLLEKI